MLRIFYFDNNPFVSHIVLEVIVCEQCWGMCRYTMCMNTVFKVIVRIRDNIMRILDNEICIEAIESSKTNADNAKVKMTCLFSHITAYALWL